MSGFLKLSTLSLATDDISSVPHCPTCGPDGKESLHVSLRGAHNSLTLTDCDDMCAVLAAVGQTESTNEFMKKHAEEKKAKAKEEAEKAKEEKADKPVHKETHGKH